MKYPLLTKVGAIALVGLMVLLALMRIEGLVAERAARAGEAVRSVEQSHAAAQTIVGPLLQRACTEEWTSETGTGANRVTKDEKHDFTLMQAPNELAIDSRTQADPLHRGLFKVNAYVAHANVSASFATLAPLQPHAENAGGRLHCDAPVLFVALGDVRGVRTASIVLDDAGVEVAPGTPNEKYPHGFHATLASSRVDGDAAARPLTAKLVLDAIGTGQLAWVPAAGSTTWTLASDWPHPSFGGQFLPEQRVLRADGFGATWKLSALATSAPADVVRGLDLCRPSAVAADADADAGDAKPQNCLDTMSVAFIDPVNPYVLSDRAVKYDLLFVALTFLAVGLIEVLSGRRVHPVQYLLVGMALSVFFLLLLSLSEHLVFELAYAIAAAACAVLLGFYASAMLGRRLAGAAFGAGIAVLYGLLYALLQMEQNALVIGAVMLFAALATVMTLTRRIDWYALFARLRLNADKSPLAQEPTR